MGTSAQFLTANASVQANTLAELIRLVKGKPGQKRYGSGGIGSVHHLSMEALKTPLGLDIIHVPYKGNGVAIPAMISGEVALVFSALPAIESHLKSGRVKLLAVNTQKRSAQAPNVPTVGEVTGIKDYDYPPANGVLAPAKTPPEIVAKLNRELVRILATQDVKDRIAAQAAEPVGSTPEQFRAYIKSEIDKWAQVVQASGAKID